MILVYAFTVPWDNWAVGRGIWGFPSERYSFRVWRLPIEEYAFFGLQTLLAIILILSLDPWLPTGTPEVARVPIPLAALVLLVWPLGLGLNFWFTPHWPPRWAYARHMLFWMLPVLVFQGLAAPDVLLAKSLLIFSTTVLLGIYLSIADHFAIGWKLWFFDENQITGYRIGKRVPWEEAAFFHLTTWMVANSFLMFRTLLAEWPLFT